MPLTSDKLLVMAILYSVTIRSQNNTTSMLFHTLYDGLLLNCAFEQKNGKNGHGWVTLKKHEGQLRCRITTLETRQLLYY